MNQKKGLLSDQYAARIDEYIEQNEAALVAALCELISVPSVKGEKTAAFPFGEASARVLEKGCALAESCGLSVTNLDSYVAFGDFFGKEKTPHLGILSHLDVVPAGNGWTKSPFCAEVENGCVFGRGAIDDKGPTVSVLFALKALKELGVPLEKTVRVILGCDEETGSDEDLARYAKSEKLPPLVFTPDADFPVINGEKGMLRAAFCEPLSGDILSLSGGEVVNAVASLSCAEVKSISREDVLSAANALHIATAVEVKEENGVVKITVQGKNAHASTPEMGVNSNTMLLSLLAQLPLTDQALFKKLATAFPFGDNHGEALGIALADEPSGKLTCVLSLLSLSEHCLHGKLDIRFPVTKKKADVSALVCAGFEKAGLSAPKLIGTEPHYTDENSELVRTLLDTYSEHTGEKGYCFSIGGGTYVHGIDGGVAFGVAKLGEDNHMHGPDEFITIAALKENAKLFAKAILNLCL